MLFKWRLVHDKVFFFFSSKVLVIDLRISCLLIKHPFGISLPQDLTKLPWLGFELSILFPKPPW